MSEELPFNEGDAVKHKAGGRKMIFVGMGDFGAICEWVDEKNKKQSDTFSLSALEPYEASPDRMTDTRRRR